MEKLWIIGHGGHAKVIGEAASLRQIPVGYIVEEADPEDSATISEDLFIKTYATSPGQGLICGLGTTGSTMVRRRVLERYRSCHEMFVNIIHPTAFVSPSATLGRGVFVAANVTLCNGCFVGDHAILNTRSSIDHDCKVGARCHIAPGTVLSGGCSVGDDVHIGVGSTLIQGIEIASSTVVGAGSLVTKKIPVSNFLWHGSPAKKQRPIE